MLLVPHLANTVRWCAHQLKEYSVKAVHPELYDAEHNIKSYCPLEWAMACVLQPIKVQTVPGKVESAIMHVIDMEASNADKRFTAMVKHTPLHAFMFDLLGHLLVANDAAMEACLHSAAGLKVPDPHNITLKSLFDLGAYEGSPLDPLDHVGSLRGCPCSLVYFNAHQSGSHG